MRSPGRFPPEALRTYLLDVPHPRSAPPRPGAPSLPEEIAPIDWAQVYGNSYPIEVEVGFGKGMFLVANGQARPEVNFLGIEIERKYVMLTAARVAKRGLPNVRLACTDARWFLRTRVADASFAAAHVYFPDPWWKKRHHKRRVMTPEFIAQIARSLRPGGQLHFVSDVKEYFDDTIRLVAEQGQLQPLPIPESGESEFLTNFERKYRLEGRPIYRSRFERSHSNEIGRNSPLL